MFSEARSALLGWFDEHRRDLPWRRTGDPYAIWVSEIMLQQTRVAAVLEHYARWMRRFPCVAAVAGADEAEVLALWSGLGYYRRARMLHHAAKVVVSEHDGELPRTAAALRTLPGIGEYTASAVASIAFREPVAVVDGNVERVVTRLFGLAPARCSYTGTSVPTAAPINSERACAGRADARSLPGAIREGAAALLSRERPGDSNQAVMELGATVCLPKMPLCLHCPLQPWCQTRGEHLRTPRPPLQSRAIAYALVERPGEVLLQQRAADASLMAGMWELPELSERSTEEAAEVALRLRHAVTVTNYAVSIVRLAAAAASRMECPGRWVPTDELSGLPLTGLTRKVLRRLEIWPRV